MSPLNLKARSPLKALLGNTDINVLVFRNYVNFDYIENYVFHLLLHQKIVYLCQFACSGLNCAPSNFLPFFFAPSNFLPQLCPKCV